MSEPRYCVCWRFPHETEDDPPHRSEAKFDKATAEIHVGLGKKGNNGCTFWCEPEGDAQGEQRTEK